MGPAAFCFNARLFLLSILLWSIGGTCNARADAGASVQKLHVITDIATCAKYFQKDPSGKTISQAQLGANCQQKFSQGLILFAFDCSHCDAHHAWFGQFILNGNVGSQGDVLVSPQLNAVWTTQPGAFKPSDCVSLLLTDSGSSSHPSYQSNALCPVMAGSLAPPAAPVSSVTPVPMGGGIPLNQSNAAPAAPLAPVTPPNGAPDMTSNTANGMSSTMPANLAPNGSQPMSTNSAPEMPMNLSPGTSSDIVPPSGLEFTDDPVTCLQHAGGNLKLCATGFLFRSNVFLIWNGGCRGCADGFYVMMVDQSGQEHKQTSSSHTVVSLSKHYSDGRCFTVRAYKGGMISDAAQPVCYKM